MGGFDIFYCGLLDDNTWNDAINIGHPINTTGDNLFYFPVGNGEQAYYSRRLKEEPFVSDIYYLEILERGATDGGLVTPTLFQDDLVLKIINMNEQDTIIIHFNHDLNRFSVKQPAGNFETIIEK